MSTQYILPSHRKDAFNCSFCGAYANQKWYVVNKHHLTWSTVKKGEDYIITYQGEYAEGLTLAQCAHCLKHSVWVDKKVVYPFDGFAPLPNPDMPEDVRLDFEEARSILTASPRGAAALLRLGVQKLLKHLGASGKHIDSDIALLVKNGLPEVVQQALDSVRVVGNSAVHPGQIDLNDNAEMASTLFGLINFIVNNQITQPKEVALFYNSLPTGAIQAIQNRDAPKPPKTK